jgi:hypothetical protein
LDVLAGARGDQAGDLPGAEKRVGIESSLAPVRSLNEVLLNIADTFMLDGGDLVPG